MNFFLGGEGIRFRNAGSTDGLIDVHMYIVDELMKILAFDSLSMRHLLIMQTISPLFGCI